MRSFVGFIVDHDETTNDLDDLIVNTVTEYTVVDHEVKVDIGEDIEEITRLLGPLSNDERAKVDAGEPLPSWNMKCGHFDSLNDPNHDCSKW